MLGTPGRKRSETVAGSVRRGECQPGQHVDHRRFGDQGLWKTKRRMAPFWSPLHTVEKSGSSVFTSLAFVSAPNWF